LEIAQAVTVTFKNVQKPLLSIDEAIKEQSFYTNPAKDFSIGDPDGAMASAKHKVCWLGSCWIKRSPSDRQKHPLG